MTKSYCESILGTFGTTACALRDEGPECQDTVPCCLNGTCADTSLEKCEKFNGIAFENIVTCAALGTCPDICPGQNGACCVNGVCYSFNQENCDIVGGIFHSGKNCNPYNVSENPNGYNCCLDSFPGACCISRDPRDDVGEVDDDNPPVPGTNCYNNYTALQCYQANGHYQGAGSSCYATDDDDNPNDLVLVGIDPSGIAILRRCCEDPCDPGDPNCIDTVNESCQIQLNPCHTYDLGAEISANENYAEKYAGYFGYPANECGAANYPIGARGRTIVDLANGEFVATNYQPTVGRLDTVAPCDHLPVIHTRAINSNTGLKINYKKGHLSELGLLLNNPFDNSTENYNADDGAKYNEFATQIYGQGYRIHRRWAIVVKDSDEEIGGSSPTEMHWGLANRIGTQVLENPLKNWATCPVDGYLNTRLYADPLLTTTNLWFWENAFGFDSEAYNRWVDISLNPWPADSSETEIENLEAQFQNSYKTMWDGQNSNTAMGTVDGEWYIPSLTEMNNLYYLQNTMNIQLNMAGIYWTSTSGKIKDTSNTVFPFGKPSEWIGQADENDESSWMLDQELAYKAASGYYAFSQNFSSSSPGRIHSMHKTTEKAQVRLIKRIPIYVASPLCYNPQSYPSILDCGNRTGPCACGGDVLL